MTEVVTNAAASLQPYLQANRLQAFGVDQPDPTASDQAANTAAIRDGVAAQTAQVSQPGDDRSAVQDNGGGNFAAWLPASTSSAGTDPTQVVAPPPTTGPAKAVVTVQAFDPAPAVQSGQQPPSPINAAILDPAEDLDNSDLEVIQEDIIGTAFAPVEMNQVGPGPRTPGQKDVIFDGHKLFGGQVPRQSSVGTPGAGVVAAAANGSFAAAAQAAQQAFAPAIDTSASSQDSQSLYERAQAIAQALGAKAPANPGVKQLFNDLALYSGGDTPKTPTVSVTA
jgi:hypothetical protein